jgi:hypothetical protein
MTLVSTPVSTLVSTLDMCTLNMCTQGFQGAWPKATILDRALIEDRVQIVCGFDVRGKLV